jgi:hypothetical protein
MENPRISFVQMYARLRTSTLPNDIVPIEIVGLRVAKECLADDLCLIAPIDNRQINRQFSIRRCSRPTFQHGLHTSDSRDDTMALILTSITHRIAKRRAGDA